ncbi:MAG TPA: GGDEF domain-containing protein [Gemmatimonadales bacterium]|nr:GGDEF domain-containing protein [Gemmatimonadales bacterium]
MRRTAVWVGRVCAVLGLAVALWGVVRSAMPGLVAGLGGALVVFGVTLPAVARDWIAGSPGVRPADFSHLIDLLRRAHAARGGWLVGLPTGDVEVLGSEDMSRKARQRGGAIVQLASADGRAHVVRDSEGTYIAVGDFPFGAGLLIGLPETSPEQAEIVADELRRVVAGMRLIRAEERGERRDLVAKQLAAIASGALTLEGVAKAGVELAQQFTQRGAAVVMPGLGASQDLQVLAVSTAADRRLSGVRVPDSAAAARAIQTGVPVVSLGREDVFGLGLPDRRSDRTGTAFPLLDGHFAIGALVVLGPPIEPDTPLSEQLQRLVMELGSRLAAARAVHEAEQRAVLDPLTGLRNRRELERMLSRHGSLEGPPPAALIYLDLDHFKQLNDALGHAAGDAALRHVGGILEEAIRDTDLAARIGGEEFAIWMPHAALSHALEVAERVRRSIVDTTWRWNGTPYPLATSGGVAGFPESVTEFANLRSAADAALYRAKQGGRNRVEKVAAPR